MDFVLKDPRPKQQTVEAPKLPHRQELEVVPKPWNQAFLTAGAAMSETLFVTNPTVAAMLRIWYQEYSHHRYVQQQKLPLQEHLRGSVLWKLVQFLLVTNVSCSIIVQSTSTNVAVLWVVYTMFLYFYNQTGGLYKSPEQKWSVWDGRFWPSDQEKPRELQEPPHHKVLHTAHNVSSLACIPRLYISSVHGAPKSLHCIPTGGYQHYKTYLPWETRGSRSHWTTWMLSLMELQWWWPISCER